MDAVMERLDLELSSYRLALRASASALHDPSGWQIQTPDGVLHSALVEVEADSVTITTTVHGPLAAGDILLGLFHRHEPMIYVQSVIPVEVLPHGRARVSVEMIKLAAPVRG